MGRPIPAAGASAVLAIVLLALPVQTGAAAADLQPGAIEGWRRYAAAVEARRDTDLRLGRFLAADRDPSAAAARRALIGGQTLVRRGTSRDLGNRSIDVPLARVHHWHGAVFLPGATLDALLRTLERDAPPTSQEILRASVLQRGPSFIKVFLRIQRSRVVTVVYNTEHEVRFLRHGPTRASSASVATRIAEVQNPGTPAERELRPGQDRGFLWRLNAYWRYEAVAGGVIAECESISLSRDIPFGLGSIAGPIISSTARESMERTLESIRRMGDSRGL